MNSKTTILRQLECEFCCDKKDEHNKFTIDWEFMS